MFITNHVLAGALIGSRLAPGPAVTVGFLSHLAMDNLPHHGFGDGPLPLTPARRDGVLGLGAIGAMVVLAPAARRPAVLAGILGACLPDTDKLGEHFLGSSPWPAAFDRFHKAIQREAPNRIALEAAAGAAMTALAVWQFRHSSD